MTEPAIVFVSGLSVTRLVSDKGHFSTVYEGLDPVRKQVAIKVPKPLPNEPIPSFFSRMSMLLKEGQHLHQASHSHVVEVHQVLQTSDRARLVLVTEFCSGGSLEDLTSIGPTPLKRSFNLLHQAALGMQCVHNCGLLHRDIKPGNILLDNTGRAKVSDFGLVTDAIVAGYANVAGYQPHLAPECFGTNGQPGVCSERTDVWAFGATAYRLINGDELWDSMGHPMYIPNLVQKGKFANRLPWLPHIPREWRAFITQMLHDDPNRRTASMADVLSALEKLPTDPDWEIDFSMPTVRWTRQVRNRIHEVVWDRSAPQAHNWKAENRPANGNGKTLRLGGSVGPVSPKEVQAGLERFFDGFVKR